MDSPNILVLVTDQQQASTVDPDSNCRMPNLESIAAEGTRFSRCYTPNSICSPSRASFFTGTLPHNHGMINVTHAVEPYGASFRDDLAMWSREVADAGYHTGYFGKWHVERSGELERFGFDEYEILWSDEFERNYRTYREERGLGPSPDRTAEALEPGYSIHDDGYDDYLLYGISGESPAGTSEHYVYSNGIDFVERASERSEPWCLTLSTYAPHDPYIALTDVFAQYDPDHVAKPPNFHDAMEDKPNIYRRQRGVWSDMSWEQYAEATTCYYASCTHVDDQIGRILETLRSTGEFENTVIVFTSDHGDLMGSHGMMLKGLPPFEEAYRVPLVIRWPGRGQDGNICQEIVQLHDLAPTLSAIAGREFPDQSRVPSRNPHARYGRNVRELDAPPSYTPDSLLPFLDGERPAGHRPEAYAEFHGQDFNWTQRIHWHGHHKYVFNTFGRDELYDLETDPGEMNNLVEDREYETVRNDLASRMWEIACETGDYQISDLHYGMHRFAPVGPNGSD